MALQLETRVSGKVWVARCVGRIVAGTEALELERAAELAAHSYARMVLEVSGVTRVDSSGIGLMVRLLTHARRRGGDLRLAAPPEFLSGLLRMTTLDRLFLSYLTEEEATASFLDQRVPALGKSEGVSRALFVDGSRDLGVFVRTVLTLHGMDVLSATSVADARLLLAANAVDLVLLRSDHPAVPLERAAGTLGTRGALVLPLPAGFGEMDAEGAGRALLKLVGREAAG